MKALCRIGIPMKSSPVFGNFPRRLIMALGVQLNGHLAPGLGFELVSYVKGMLAEQPAFASLSRTLLGPIL